SELNFIVNLSGVGVLENFKGSADNNWRMEVVRLYGFDIGMGIVLTRVSSLLPALPPDRADGSSAAWGFVPLQWTVYASFNSVFNAGTSVNAGYEIDDRKIVRRDIITNPGTTIRIFEGFEVDLSVRDKDGQINKIAYEVNMHGYFGIQWNPRID